MPVTNYHTVNGKMIGQTTSGARTDYLTDALGSVTGTVNSAGSFVNTYRYKPYGNPLSSSGGGTTPRYRWTGNTGSRRTDVNLYSEIYNRARHYGAIQGQWTTVDPLWPVERTYAYVSAQVATLVDPIGTDPVNLRFYAFILGSRGRWLPYPTGIVFPDRPGMECQFQGDRRNFREHLTKTSRMSYIGTVDSTRVGRYGVGAKIGNASTGITHRRCRVWGTNSWIEDSKLALLVWNNSHSYDVSSCSTVFGNSAGGLEAFVSQITPKELFQYGAIVWNIEFQVTVFSKRCDSGMKKFVRVQLIGHNHTKFPDFEGYASAGGREEELYAKESDYSGPGPGTLGTHNTISFSGRSAVWEVNSITPGC